MSELVATSLVLVGVRKCLTSLVADQIATLVLDEADRLLDQGFRPELLKILNALPNREVSKRQTLLFTATVPDGIRKVSTSDVSLCIVVADC